MSRIVSGLGRLSPIVPTKQTSSLWELYRSLQPGQCGIITTWSRIRAFAKCVNCFVFLVESLGPPPPFPPFLPSHPPLTQKSYLSGSLITDLHTPEDWWLAQKLKSLLKVTFFLKIATSEFIEANTSTQILLLDIIICGDDHKMTGWIKVTWHNYCQPTFGLKLFLGLVIRTGKPEAVGI